MKRYPDLTETMARRIDRRLRPMARLSTQRELEEHFLPEGLSILPADFVCWNNWSNRLNRPISMESNAEYKARAESLNDAFAATVAHHPAFIHFDETLRGVVRLSDLQSVRQFRRNPVFREVYRHLDSHYQLAFTPVTLRHHKIVLTWNRLAMDFDERERQLFHYMGSRLGAIGRRIQEREEIEAGWRRLCGFIDLRLPSGNAASLLETDLVVMGAMLRCRTPAEIARELGVRRDSLDKRLGSIREKLGMENHYQLLSALAELKPQQ